MKLLLLYLFLNKKNPKQDTLKSSNNYFIAMQYKGLSNCIYKVYITDSLIMCAKVNGYISTGLVGTVIPRSKAHDPEAYVNKKMAAQYDELLNDNDKFIAADKQNIIINKADVISIQHDPEKKWGMGYYPHNGVLIIQTSKKVKRYNNALEREFILVGDQDAQAIVNKLKN